MANEAVAGNAIPLIRTVPGQHPQPSDPRVSRQAERPFAVRGAIEATLTAFLTGEVGALDEIDPAAGDFGRTAQDAVLAGGKRIRPVFAYWGWRGVVGGSEPVAPVLPALAALELLHAFALVHDDVMDASATRRGRPSAHRALAAQHAAAGRTGDGDRFGEAAAVLVGDLCLVWADRLLGHANLPAATILEARRCYDQMRVETVAGQYLDVLSETAVSSWSLDRAMRVARYKTACYTVQRPLLFGAALADLRRDGPLAAAYHRYGLAVGEAFQLCDDLLGVYGDPRTTGKPAGEDLLRNKPTGLLMLARELATPAQRAVLDGVRPTPADSAAPGGSTAPDGSAAPDGGSAGSVRELAEVVRATGAVDRIERLIADRVDEALTALDSSPIDPAARHALGELAVSATQRRA
ncbi:polyprenyl synthetase family protein [Plantactinospora siamensis]|uniref:Polyprenyl synthetase family protein n=1 Tax=Plantactinospora siamensis TaxID=555372 RepID=A0ABV6NRM0_9ACTN